MPRYLDVDYVDYRIHLLTDAYVRLLNERGVRGPSVRALAASIGVAPSTLLHHLGTQARIRHLMAQVVAARLRVEASARVSAGRAGGLLPDPGLTDSLERRRAWAGFVSMSHGDGDVAAVVRRHDLETLALTRALFPTPRRPSAAARWDGREREGPLDDDEVLRLALVEGLRHLAARRVAPVPPAQAVRILRAVLGAGGRGNSTAA